MEDPRQDLIREFREILNYYAAEKDSLLCLIKRRAGDELSEHRATRRLLGLPSGALPTKIHERDIELCAGMLIEHPKYLEMAERYQEQISRIETQMLLPGATNLKLLIPEYLRAGLDYLSYSAGCRFIGDVCDSGYVHDLELETDGDGLKLVAKTAPVEFFPRVKWINFCWQLLLNNSTDRVSPEDSSKTNSDEAEKPLKGFKGLPRDRQREMEFENLPGGDKLTEKQKDCGLLVWVYRCSKTDTAVRLGINRKTVDEHLEAAQKKIDHARQNSKKQKSVSGQ